MFIYINILTTFVYIDVIGVAYNIEQIRVHHSSYGHHMVVRFWIRNLGYDVSFLDIYIINRKLCLLFLKSLIRFHDYLAVTL